MSNLTINQTTVNIRIKELRKLLKTCKHPYMRVNFERELRNYLTIKRLLDETG